MTADLCTAARQWLSADRDGEALPDPELRDHVTACARCREWVGTVDRLTSRMRLQPAGGPDLTVQAIQAFATATAHKHAGSSHPRTPAIGTSQARSSQARSSQAHSSQAHSSQAHSFRAHSSQSRRHRTRTAGSDWATRILLALAGVGGLVLGAISVAGALGAGWAPASAHVRHLGYDLAVLESALAAGFLLSAWRPDSYTRGLVPVCIVASLLALAPSTAVVSVSAADALTEASHLPVLLGTFALLFQLSARRSPAGSPSAGAARRGTLGAA